MDWKGKDISIMVSDPEACRLLLEDRFLGLKIWDENEVDKGGTTDMHC